MLLWSWWLVCHGFQIGRTDLYEVITVCCTKELWVTKASSRSCCGSMVRRMDQMCDDVLFGYILHIGALNSQEHSTWNVLWIRAVIVNPVDSVNEVCLFLVLLVTPSPFAIPSSWSFYWNIFKKILPNFLLMYNIMLGSGIFHSDLTFTHIMKWSCGVLVAICPHTNLLKYYRPYCLWCILHFYGLFIL